MTLVDPANMPWEWVRSGLEHVIQRTGALWTPADVYNALHNKQASLYMLGPDAFVVVQRLVDYAGPYLFVWALYGPNLLKSSRHDVMKQIRGLAVQCGCRYMEMRSPRKWEGTDLGWRPRETIYVADVW